MLLGGLWHGAGWTFVAWGGVHGLMLVVAHLWHDLRRRLGHDPERSTLPGRALARGLTFTAVVAAWVPFRAESFEAAGAILAGMAGLHGMVAPASWARLIGPLAPVLEGLGWQFLTMRGGLFGGIPQVAFLALLGVVTFLFPNTQEWTGYRPADREVSAPRGLPLPRWRPGLAHGSALGLACAWVLLALIAETPTEFLYFQF
jgi:alginate O-acetyltransferase complex protein AlgI